MLSDGEDWEIRLTSVELTEPEALADFLRHGSASASGSIDIETRTDDRVLALALRER